VAASGSPRPDDRGRGGDPLSTALAAVLIGATAGGAVLCLVLLSTYWMTRGPDSTFAQIVVLGGAGGLIAGATVAWAVGRALGTWRRATAATVAAAGTAFVGVLTTVADMVGGPGGLIALAALCIMAMVAAYRLTLARGTRP
jgi:hypothetical protein